jgi:hypothetical protein
VYAAAPASEQAQQILAHLHFPAGEHVPYTQSQVNPLLRSVARQQGVMFKSPDQGLVMRITAPRPEERTLHDGLMTLRRETSTRHGPGKRTVTRRMKLDPNKPGHLPLLALQALLYGDVALLAEHFQLAASAHGAGWQVSLVPQNERVREKLARLLIVGTDSQLSGFRSERDNAAGDTTHWLEVVIDTPPAHTASGPET